MLEAGPPTYEDPAHVQPARYLSHLLPGSKTVRFYESKKMEQLGGRSVVIPCGQCLGGGSSVNCTFDVGDGARYAPALALLTMLV